MSTVLTPPKTLVEGAKLLAFCLQRKAVLVGAATRLPISTNVFVFVFPTASRKHCAPGITSPFVQSMINEFYPAVHPDFKEHRVTLTTAFQHRDQELVKVVQLYDSHHQFHLDHDPKTFCHSYAAVRKESAVRKLFGCDVLMNLGF